MNSGESVMWSKVTCSQPVLANYMLNADASAQGMTTILMTDASAQGMTTIVVTDAPSQDMTDRAGTLRIDASVQDMTNNHVMRCR